MSEGKATREKPEYHVLSSRTDIPEPVFWPAQTARKAGDPAWSEACSFCGKFDEAAYLDAGCSLLMEPGTVRSEFGYSKVSQLIVNSRVLHVLRQVPGACFREYAVGPAPEPTHWVLYPEQVIEPPDPVPRKKKGAYRYPDNTAFLSHGDKCSTCGRYREVTFGHEWLPIPTGTVLAAVVIEGPAGPQRHRWVGGPGVVAALKEARIPKLFLEPLENRWRG